ncbi:hypothetical protein POM88_016089 [Heracleum sosnowskyi]|uniref:Uncharacterized protein n=1 Tax=Heracleum sosnowskyi TaxID=360622 RepID=A0AAD8IN69_9APIA|nr:hypothetical protein POM88_016089 [Heracleum sosnowskyi]
MNCGRKGCVHRLDSSVSKVFRLSECLPIKWRGVKVALFYLRSSSLSFCHLCVVWPGLDTVDCFVEKAAIFSSSSTITNMKSENNNVGTVPIAMIVTLMRLVVVESFKDFFSFFVAWAQPQRRSVVVVLLGYFPLRNVLQFLKCLVVCFLSTVVAVIVSLNRLDLARTTWAAVVVPALTLCASIPEIFDRCIVYVGVDPCGIAAGQRHPL